jgi:hypothetical protein
MPPVRNVQASSRIAKIDGFYLKESSGNSCRFADNLSQCVCNPIQIEKNYAIPIQGHHQTIHDPKNPIQSNGITLRRQTACGGMAASSGRV